VLESSKDQGVYLRIRTKKLAVQPWRMHDCRMTENEERKEGDFSKQVQPPAPNLFGLSCVPRIDQRDGHDRMCTFFEATTFVGNHRSELYITVNLLAFELQQ